LKKLLARLVRQSPAMIVAMLALFVALTGTAVATTSALITGRQIANGSITGLDVKNRSLTPRDFRGSVRGPRGLRGLPGAAGVAGAAGAKGDKGDKGDTGEPATRLWAAIAGGASPTIAKNSGAATAVDRTVGVGQYRVTWNRDISTCGWIGTAGGIDTGGIPPDAYVSIHRSSAGAQILFVEVRNNAGVAIDADFTVAVFC
jgi:hypothetical protein